LNAPADPLNAGHQNCRFKCTKIHELSVHDMEILHHIREIPLPDPMPKTKSLSFSVYKREQPVRIPDADIKQ